ncbi:MAG: hypothetical protein IPM54_33060 [Polyangiaceae bacterium]|nr:hypothetical protein [Polyangiaceae bacterium]
MRAVNSSLTPGAADKPGVVTKSLATATAARSCSSVCVMTGTAVDIAAFSASNSSNGNSNSPAKSTVGGTNIPFCSYAAANASSRPFASMRGAFANAS